MKALFRRGAPLLLSRRLLRTTELKFSSLVIAEHDHESLLPGTLSAITAASKIIGSSTTVLVAGESKGVASVSAKASKIAGVSKVLKIESDSLAHPSAEQLADIVSQLAKDFTHVLAPSSNHGKNFLPRAAALLDSSPVSDVLEVVESDVFKRPMYAGNAIATVKMTDKIKFLLIRPTAFSKAVESTSATAAPIESSNVIASEASMALSTFVSETLAKSERPELSSARIVVSGGRALKSAENFKLIESLADKLGAAVGASRAAVDAGYITNEYQVGQTGKVVAPDIYIAVGISGAIQHLSGMKDSKIIIAINKDKEAPIFSVADYGLVDDLFKVVPELTSKL